MLGIPSQVSVLAPFRGTLAHLRLIIAAFDRESGSLRTLLDTLIRPSYLGKRR